MFCDTCALSACGHDDSCSETMQDIVVTSSSSHALAPGLAQSLDSFMYLTSAIYNRLGMELAVHSGVSTH